MSERDKDMIEKIADTLPKMGEYDKGYLMCLVEQAEKIEPVDGKEE